MSVFFTIINMILMVMLLVLLLIIILMLIVLFTPLRYNVRASYIDEDVGYNIRVSWLFRLVSLHMRHVDGCGSQTLRVAWKHLLDDTNVKSERVDHVDDKEISSDESTKQTNEKERDPPKEGKEIKADNEDKPGFIDKLKNAYNKTLERIKNYNELIESFNALNLDIGELLSDIKLAFKRLFFALRPRVFFLDLELGFETPDLTGMIIGGLAVLEETIESFNRKRYKLNIKGDFEEKKVSLKTDIRGKVSLWNIMWPFIRLYFSKSMKPIRKTIIDTLFRGKKTRRNTNGK